MTIKFQAWTILFLLHLITRVFLPFEFSLRVQDVLGYLMPIIPKKGHEEDQMWFSGDLDKSTGKVISAAIGRGPH